MSYTLKKCNTVKIVYFSGTGCTAKVADVFEKLLLDRCIQVKKTELRSGQTEFMNDNEDMLLLLYAVHACNAPAPVYEWIKEIPMTTKKPAVVISVSGGGEVFPNIACRVGCIKRLEKKGFDVVYEKMIVMPSNWIVATYETTAVRLLSVLPSKIEKIIDDLLHGIHRRTKAGIFDKIICMLGELEKSGTKSFGKRISVSHSCSGCGWCEKSCPRSNIKLMNGKPVFSNRCILCLKCIYGCPNKALAPGFMKFIAIKDGFNIHELEKRMSIVQPVTDDQIPKGYLWKGVRKYLLDSEGTNQA